MSVSIAESQQAAANVQQAVMNGAIRHPVSKYNPKGNRIGWLMMSSIRVEAWDLYSIAFVLVFIREQYHPDPFPLIGLLSAIFILPEVYGFEQD
jgi:hypothetical protein